MTGRTWDIFCRVIDNFGDVGVCWRLAADLASRGERVRLWIDDPSALAWMAPSGAANVRVMHWTDETAHDSPLQAPGDVVVEAFGCDPPAGFVRSMAARRQPPCWINLEYLSAEGYVERSHQLASPQRGGPGAGLTKWFFYPGFTPATGGLIREAGLMERRRAFDADAWLHGLGITPDPREERISLFSYETAALDAVLQDAATRPTLLLLAAGVAARQVIARLGPSLRRGALRCITLPALTQTDYDHLLWACDLNVVRGEDSFVRAQWAGVPFVWQIYPQADGAHARKLQAFMERFLETADAALASDVRALNTFWNGLASAPPRWPDREAWRAHCVAWREHLSTQADLTTQLIDFAADHR